MCAYASVVNALVAIHLLLLMSTGTSLDDVQIQDGSTIDLEDSSNVCYSLWVSFAEIYNEFIYDLLGEEPKARRRRPALKLAEDKNHNHFIKGKSTTNQQNSTLVELHVLYIHTRQV